MKRPISCRSLRQTECLFEEIGPFKKGAAREGRFAPLTAMLNKMTCGLFVIWYADHRTYATLWTGAQAARHHSVRPLAAVRTHLERGAVAAEEGRAVRSPQLAPRAWTVSVVAHVGWAVCVVGPWPPCVTVRHSLYSNAHTFVRLLFFSLVGAHHRTHIPHAQGREHQHRVG